MEEIKDTASQKSENVSFKLSYSSSRFDKLTLSSWGMVIGLACYALAFFIFVNAGHLFFGHFYFLGQFYFPAILLSFVAPIIFLVSFISFIVTIIRQKKWFIGIITIVVIAFVVYYVAPFFTI